MRIAILDRLLLLLTSLLAAWQVAVGIDGAEALPLIAYTTGFGVLLVAGLLIIILGWEALESPAVVILSTIIPLSLSLGLVWEHLVSLRLVYLIFAACGFLAIIITRLVGIHNQMPAWVLTVVHGLAGMTIFVLPLLRVITGEAKPAFALVGIGGGILGLEGLLLSFLKIGKPLLPKATILKFMPGVLCLTTAAFILGFSAR